MTREADTETPFREKYAARVREATPETLPGLIEEMMSEKHDYGTICIAIGLAAAATGWAMNRHPGASGGITGFQAGAVFWEFARGWGTLPEDCVGMRLVDFDQLLFPQYDRSFEPTVSPGIMERVRERATEFLSEEDRVERSHPDVVAHWRFLTEGGVPFGLTVKDN